MDQISIVIDLTETMRKKSQVLLPSKVKCLMIQLLRAIYHLHDNWILNEDLKLSDLIIDNGILRWATLAWQENIGLL